MTILWMCGKAALTAPSHLSRASPSSTSTKTTMPARDLQDVLDMIAEDVAGTWTHS